jgi:hypothetical protein
MCFSAPKAPKPTAQPAAPPAQGADNLLLGPTSNDDQQLRNSGLLGRLALKVGRAVGRGPGGAPGGDVGGVGNVGSGSGGSAGGSGSVGSGSGGLNVGSGSGGSGGTRSGSVGTQRL